MGRGIGVKCRVARNRDLLEQKAVQPIAQRLHRGINQADDDAPGIRRRFELQLRRRRHIPGLHRLRGRRAVYGVVAFHGSHVGVVGQFLARGIRGGLVLELEAIGVEAADPAGHLGAEELGQLVYVRAGLEPNDQLVRNDLALGIRQGGFGADELGRILHGGLEDKEPGAAIGPGNEGEVHVAEQQA